MSLNFLFRSLRAKPLINIRSAFAPALTPVRMFSSTYILRAQEATTDPAVKKFVTLTFVDRDGENRVVKAKIGTNLLDTAIDKNIDLEGACEGTLSCSTCHLILKEKEYDQLKEPSDEENDMLDLAFGLEDTSRLACQITIKENMDGWVFTLPQETVDARD